MTKNKKKLPHKIKDGGVFACDVDDTLLTWFVPVGYEGPVVETNLNNAKDLGVPNYYAINHLKKMKARNFTVIVWSAGGSDWAECVVKALQLEEYVDLIMPKIQYHLDDNPDSTDKIGKWQYISPEGVVYQKNSNGAAQIKEDGTIKVWKGQK